MVNILEKLAAKSSKKPTLHEKVDALTKKLASSNKPEAKPKVHVPVKLGLVNSGLAGASTLVGKVRQTREDMLHGK